MKIFKSILIWVFGFICGVIVIYIFSDSKSSTAVIAFKNNSDFIINRIIVSEDKYANNYFIENLKQNDHQKVYLFTRGEIGYKIDVELENGKKFSTGGYAETGYRDLYIIKNDSIIFKPFSSY